jgi:exopolysaccharide biosynthesis operon protein EpsL
VDKSLSLQRLELEAGVENHRYATFDYLDFTALNYSAIWHWSLTPELHGRLSSTHRESLNSFVDYTGYRTRNLRTDETRRFDSTLDLGSAWHLLGAIDQTTRTNGETFNQEDDNRLTTLEVGVRRDFRSGAALAYVAKTGRGEYFNREQALVSTQFDNRFDQREDEVSLNWPIDGKLSVDARLAHVERTHEHFSDRDYGGNTATLAATWRPTAKTSVRAGFRRELSSYQSGNASYISTDRFTLNPQWQITAKTALRGRYDYARRNYRGAIAASAEDGRLDTQQIAAIELEWQALKDLTLSASLQNDRRRSNISGVDYSSTAAGISARIDF